MGEKKVVDYLDNVKFNMIFLTIMLIISWIIGISSYVHPSANHGAIVPYILPPFFFTCTVIVYFLSRIFIKKYNWIISIAGTVINLYYAIQWYINNNI